MSAKQQYQNRREQASQARKAAVLKAAGECYEVCAGEGLDWGGQGCIVDADISFGEPYLEETRSGRSYVNSRHIQDRVTRL